MCLVLCLMSTKRESRLNLVRLGLSTQRYGSEALGGLASNSFRIMFEVLLKAFLSLKIYEGFEYGIVTIRGRKFAISLQTVHTFLFLSALMFTLSGQAFRVHGPSPTLQTPCFPGTSPKLYRRHPSMLLPQQVP